jgi:hypothetical protein
MRNPYAMAGLLVAVSMVSATAGWVFRDARARGLSRRKAFTWAGLTSQEWPLLFLLYRRTRPQGSQRAEPPRHDPTHPASGEAA